MPEPISPQTTHRRYREQHSPYADEARFQVVVGETDLWVAAKEDLSREIAVFAAGLRGEIQAYMALAPEFRTSFVPIDVLPEAPEVPDGLISQYLPLQYSKVREGALKSTPRELIIDHIQDILQQYHAACEGVTTQDA